MDKIRRPEVTTERRYQAMCDLFGDILTMRKVGYKGRWFAPWDELIRWRGVQEAMFDLVERPDMVNLAVSRLVDAHLHELEQWEELDLVTRNDDNTRVGSGGRGYMDELPRVPHDPAHPRPANL